MTSLRMQFRENGYVVINDLLSSAEASNYAKYLEDLSGITLNNLELVPFRWNLKDGISKTPFFWSLIFNKDLLDIVKEILNSSIIRYTEQSELKVWARQPASGWHRDNISKQYGIGLEWGDGSDRYKVVRVAFYLQAWEDDFLWGAIPGSHRYEHALSNWEKKFWQGIIPTPEPKIRSRLPYLDASDGRLWVRTQPAQFILRPPTQPHWLRTKPVNCVIFDPRLIHVGGPVPNRKYAALFSFGTDNEFSHNHFTYHSPIANGKSDDSIGKSFKIKLCEAGLLFD